jgi:hypothetical protein
MVLAFGPYLVLPKSTVEDFANNPAWRTRFFSSPLLAISWAIVIALLGTMLKLKQIRAWIVGITCVLVLVTTANALQFQRDGGFLNRRADYASMRSIYRQIKQLRPNMIPNTPILFILNDDERSPLGFNYFLRDMTCLVLQSPAFQGSFKEDGFLPMTRNTLLLEKLSEMRYVFENAEAFRVDSTGIASSVPIPPVTPSTLTVHIKPTCEDLVTVREFWPPLRYLKNLAD